MHFSTKKWPLSGGALRAQFISNLAARYARKGRAGGLLGRAARYARTLTSGDHEGTRRGVFR